MKKSISLICISLVILLLLGSVFACTDGTRKLYFTETTYKLYLSDEDPSIVPEVFTRPRGNDYVLTVSNPTIAKVEGNKVTALKEGIVTLTATSGDMTATAKLIVYVMRDATNDDDKAMDGKHTVYFITEYSAVPAQRVEDGGLATEPTPPLREGYKLFGWYMDKEFTIPYDFASPVRGNINLYALWGYASPAFAFTTVNDKSYVSGLKYPYIPYENIELPATDDNGNMVYGVTSGAFSGNQSMVSLTIPDCYEIIEDRSFDAMAKLESVVIKGAGLKEIEELAFYNCPSLKTVDLGGEGLKKIGPSCFNECVSLTSIVLPNSITEIGKEAFYNCKSLRSVTLPSSLEVIQENTFSYTAIESIDLNGIVAIYNQAFWGATSLKTISNPDSLLSLGSYVFGSLLSSNQSEATAWLKENSKPTAFGDKVGSNANYLGNVLVYVSPVGIGTKPLPTYIKQSTTTIASQAFSDVTDACAYFIGLTPPTYGTFAFGGGISGSLEPTVDIVVPEGMTETYSRAFLITVNEYDPTIYSLNLIQKIYEIPFNANTYVDNMIMYERYPFAKHDSGIIYSKEIAQEKGDKLAGIKYSTTEKYFVLHSYFGKAQEIDLQAMLYADSPGYTPYLEKICSYAFSKNDKLATLKLPNTIKYVDAYAFMECTALTELHLLGDPSYAPHGSQIVQSSFNLSLMPKTMKVYVHNAQLENYNDTWAKICTALKGRLVGVLL